VWTRARVAEVIKRQFGVAYHPDQVGRLLRAVGWSVQKPIERATQRDEAAIATWREEQWPDIKKKRRRKAGPSSG
jgi:transposase